VNFTPTIDKMIERNPESDDYVAGTERTGSFAKILHTDLGRVAFRLTGGYVRVRVEPANTEAAEKLAKKLTWERGWKQPSDSGENRFSKMFYTSDDAIAGIEFAIKALGREGKKRRRGTVRYWRWPIRSYLARPTAIAV
jgi:hypothetical protein